MPFVGQGMTAKDRILAKAITKEASKIREQNQNYIQKQMEYGAMPSARELMQLGAKNLMAGTVQDVPSAIQEMRKKILDQTAKGLAGMQLEPADLAKVGGETLASGTAQSAAKKLGSYNRATQPNTAGPVKVDWMGVTAERNSRIKLLEQARQQLQQQQQKADQKAATLANRDILAAKGNQTGYGVSLSDAASDEYKAADDQARDIRAQQREIELRLQWLEGQNTRDIAEHSLTRQNVKAGYSSDIDLRNISDGNTMARELARAIQVNELGGAPTSAISANMKLAQALTDRQRDTVMAFAGRGDWDGATRYLESISEETSQQVAKNTYDAMPTAGKALYWIPGGLDQFASGIAQLGKREANTPSVTSRVSQMVREDAEEISPALSFAYDLGTSISNMAPSILLSVAGGAALSAAGVASGTAGTIASGVSSAALGASAGGNAYAEKKRQGYGDTEAAAYATLVGASEAGLQYVLGGISKLGVTPASKVAAQVAKIDNAFGQAALRLGANMLSEGVEEGLQSVLEPAFATLILDEKYQVSPQEVVTSFIMGALTAGILEGSGAVRAGKAGHTVSQNGGFDTTMDGYLGADGVDYFRGVKNLEGTETGYEILKDYYSTIGEKADTTTQQDITRQYTMRKAWYEGQEQARRATGQENVQQATGNVQQTRGRTADGMDMSRQAETFQQAQEAQETAAPSRESAQVTAQQVGTEADGTTFQRVQPIQPGDLTQGTKPEDHVSSTTQNLNEGAGIHDQTEHAATTAGATTDPAGAGAFGGGQGRVYGEGTGQQAGILESRPGAAAQTSEQSRAASERLDRAANLRGQEVSSAQLGISRGTDTANVLVMPQEMWDTEMTQVAQEVQRKTGATVTYVMGGMEVTHTDGSVGKVRGVQMPGQIIVQADHSKLSVSQIANHEAFHELASRDSEMVRTAEERIKGRYDADEFNAVVATYIQKLQGVIDIPPNGTVEQINEAFYQIMEEIYADAYAGINAFGVQAGQYQETIRELVQEREIAAPSRETAQATERTTGPTSEDEVARGISTDTESRERFSIEETEDGKAVAVVDNDILSSLDTSTWNKEKRNQARAVAKSALLAFKDGIQVNGVHYKVNNKSRNEYVSSRDSSRLYDRARNTFADKMRAADNLDDVITATTSWANDGYLKHERKDNFVDFLHGDVLIQAGENQYTGDTVVAVTDRGELVFYDVVGMTPTSFKLKEGSPAAASGKNTVSNISANPSGTSIPQLDTNDKEMLTETSVGDDGNIYLPGGPVPEAVKRQRAKDAARSQETKRQEKFSVEDEEILTETEVGDDGNIYLPGGPVPEAVKRMRAKSLDRASSAAYDGDNQKGAVYDEQGRIESGAEEIHLRDERNGRPGANAEDGGRKRSVSETPGEGQRRDSEKVGGKEESSGRYKNAIVEHPKTEGSNRAKIAAGQYTKDIYFVRHESIQDEDTSNNRQRFGITTKDGTVFLSDQIPDHLGVSVGVHEAVHVAKRKGFTPYTDFLSEAIERIDQAADETIETLNTLAYVRFKKEFMDLSVDEVETVYDELNAYVWGYHRGDKEKTKARFAAVFNDYDNYIRELDTVMEQLRLNHMEESASGQTAPEPVQQIQPNGPEKNSVEDEETLAEFAIGDDGNIYLPGGPVPEAVKRQRAKDAARSQETKRQEKFSVDDEEILTETEVGDDGNIYLPGGPVPEAVKRRRAVEQGTNTTGQSSSTAEQRATTATDNTETQASKKKKPKSKKALKDTKAVAQSKAIIAKKDLNKTMMSLFSIPDGKKQTASQIIERYADKMIRDGELTYEDRNALFNRLYEEGVVTVEAEDLYQEGRRAVARGRVYVNEKVKGEFSDDWNSFRKRAFAAGVYLTSDPSDHTPDSWNVELSQSFPGLFDPGELSERTILERIVEVAEEGKAEKMTLAEYTASMVGREFQSLDDAMEGIERQMDWALRTFAEKANLELYLRDRTGRKIQQEREASAEARRAQEIRNQDARAKEREARRKIVERQRERRELSELQQKTLKQLQWLSKNRYRAPNELKKQFDEVLGDIDILAVNAANEMNWSKKHQATWKDLRQMYLTAQKQDPNFLPSPELERIVSRLDKDKIGDMDVDALGDLYRAAIGLRTEFYNRNNVLDSQKGELFSEVYRDVVDEITSAPKKLPGERGTVTEEADTFFNSEILTPMNVLHRMAGWAPEGAWHDMAMQLERGERDVRSYYVKANKMLENFLKENEAWVKTADGQGKNGVWHELEVPQLLELNMGDKPIFGDTVKVYMTPAQKVHLYLESKNTDNLRHIAMGGRTFANKDIYAKGKREEAFAAGKTIRLAPESVKKIVSDLTEQEMALANILEKYYNDFAREEMNRVSNILVGYDKAISKDYAPIYTNENYSKSDIGIYEINAETVGRSKNRQEYASNPSYNMSAFEAFERHVNDISRYVGMAIPARNWKSLISWKVKDGSMQDSISHQWGKEGVDYISELLVDLQTSRRPDSSKVGKWGDALVSKYISSIFGLNPSIVLKQIGSIPLAMPYLGASNMPGLVKVAKIDRALIRKYTQDLDYRLMGYSMPETKILKENPGKLQTNKVLNFTFGGGAITATDGWAASVLWPWAENKVRKEQPDLLVGSQEMIDSGQSPFYQAVAKEFERAVSRSQSTTATMFSSRARRSRHAIPRALTLFKTDAAQGYNTLRQMVGEAQYYARKGDKKMANRLKLRFGQGVVGLLAGYLWSEGINLLMELWKRQGDKYKDEKGELQAEAMAQDLVYGVVTSMFGLVPGAGEAAEFIACQLTGDTWYGMEIMGAEQFNEWLQYLGGTGIGIAETMEGAINIVSQGGSLPKYLEDSSEKILGWIVDAAKATGQFLGVPISNLETYSVGLMKWVAPAIATTYEDMKGSGTKSNLSGLRGEALEARTQYILERRAGEVSMETVEQLAQLYEAGMADAIPAEPTYKIKTSDGEREMTAAERQLYDAAWGEVGKSLEELVQSQEFQNFDRAKKTSALKTLYDYAKAKADAAVNPEHEVEKSEAAIDTFLKEGGTIEEWATLKAGTKDLQSGDKYRAIAESDMTEDAKIAAIGAEMGTEMKTASGNQSQYAKMLEVLDYGVDLDEYLDLREAGEVDSFMAQVEAGVNIDAGTFLRVVKAIEAVDDNGRITQAEAEEGLRNIPGLTNEERAELWQLQDKRWNPEKNPFDVDAGRRILSMIQG